MGSRERAIEVVSRTIWLVFPLLSKDEARSIAEVAVDVLMAEDLLKGD